MAWEQSVGYQARSQLPGHLLPLQGRVACSLRFNLRRPKSLAKRHRHHVRQPDCDNFIKSLLDGLEAGGILSNDSQVTDIVAAKRYADQSHHEGVEIVIMAWPAP